MAQTLEPIEPTRLTAVTGGSTQVDPGLIATMSTLRANRKSANRSAALQQQQMVRALGTAMSSLVTSVRQSQQQSSQAMMQMLPQMLRR